MEDIEKLKCNESVEMSDGEQVPDEKPKKKKRRKREIDMIFNDDDDDESAGEAPQSRKPKFSSPGPNSPGFVREPRSCVLKASQKRKPLSRLLEQLLRNLEKRDPNQFFAWPVNDNFAPNYSNIIRKPMDFSTMKQKIDDNAYRSLNCFINDFKLICNNAMKYNKPGTVYHKAAKRLLHVGLKQLTPAKLRPLATILTYMYEIPIRELGFDIGKMDMSVQQKLLQRGGSATGSDEAKSGEESEPAPEPRDDDAVKIKMAEAREKHRQRLAKKAFPRMDEEGKTTLRLVTDTVTQDGAERPVTLGQLVGKLAHGTGALQTYREDRRNLVKGVKPLYYGPFSSYAPSYDSCFATLTKDESHLLYYTLNAELGMGNEETLRFAADSPWAAIYDMEQLFPEKKPPEPAPQPTVELNKVKVDIEELRTLSELGIDTEFLNEIEEEVAGSQKDYGIQGALQHNYDLLARLEREQRDRLSSSVPAHLALVRGATGGEREAARGVAACLRSMLARVPPRHLATLAALRHAMGVTLSHLDTPMSVDELEDIPGNEEIQHTLDVK